MYLKLLNGLDYFSVAGNVRRHSATAVVMHNIWEFFLTSFFTIYQVRSKKIEKNNIKVIREKNASMLIEIKLIYNIALPIEKVVRTFIFIGIQLKCFRTKFTVEMMHD